MTEPRKISDKAIDTIATLIVIGLAMIVIIGIIFAIIFAIDALVPHEKTAKADPLVAAIEEQTRLLREIDEKVTALAAPRTLSIKTDVLTITVIPTENLGVKPLPRRAIITKLAEEPKP